MPTENQNGSCRPLNHIRGQHVESSSDEEPDGTLIFTPAESEISPSSSTCAAEEPSENQGCHTGDVLR